MKEYIFATLKPLPEYIEVVGSTLKNMAVSSLNETGCLRYDVFRDSTEAAVFHIFEEYTDAEAIAMHRASPHYQTYRQFVADKLSENPVVSMMKIF